MRIFLTYHPSGNLSVPNSNTWYKNLYAPLVDLGHEVFVLRLDEVAIKYKVPFRSKKFKELFSSELNRIFFEEHRKKPFDVFLSYLTTKDVYGNVIVEIKKAGVPTLNFSCNNTHQFHLVADISAYFDYNLHAEKDAAIKFTSIGAKPIWFPMAANPKYYFPVAGDFKYDVSFVGANYAKRAYYIKHLLENQINIHCFGPNWLINKPYPAARKIFKELVRIENTLKYILSFNAARRFSLVSSLQYYDLQCYLRKKFNEHMHYPISDEEMIQLYSSSKINLGFLEVFSVNNDANTVLSQHIHLREFEIPMCGGLYITNYSDELAEFYEPDREVIMFRNEHELIDKVTYFLKHEKEADQLRQAGYNRAINNHTCQIRFLQLFKEISIK